MAKFEFDLEQADVALENAENLLSIFWNFFCIERPAGEAKPDSTEVLWFVRNCKTYESVLNTALEKINAVHADIMVAIEKYFADEKKKSDKKGGEVA